MSAQCGTFLEPVVTDLDGRTWVHGPFTRFDGRPTSLTSPHDCARCWCDDRLGCIGVDAVASYPLTFEEWVWRQMSAQCREWGLSDEDRSALLRRLA